MPQPPRGNAPRFDVPIDQTLQAAKARQDRWPNRINHLIIVARAGTGKTTTLVEGLKVMRGLPSRITPSPQQRAIWDELMKSKSAKFVCFVAFNKSIASELRDRVPQGCDAMTMHALGYKAVRKAFPSLREPNKDRVKDIIEELTGKSCRDWALERPAVVPAVESLVGFIKQNLAGPCPEEGITWDDVIDSMSDHYDIDLNDSREIIADLVPRVIERCKDVSKDLCIDFNDMIWLPVALDLPLFKYNLLLVDEAQDLNRCQQALARKAGYRLVLCGDPRQAIYGFAGADSDSMPRMERELGALPEGCVTLPLNVTRRCGKAIVARARQVVADFEAHESNGEGKVSEARYPTQGRKDRRRELPIEQTYLPLVKDGDMVLCRVNAPLISECFRFLKMGRKATIQGRDVSAGLVSVIQKICKKDRTVPVERVIAGLDAWLSDQIRKEQARKRPDENKIQRIQDRYDCLMVFCSEASDAGQVLDKINALFTDRPDEPGIRLSSIHRAKGLEARRVFFLRPEDGPCPHPMAKTHWEQQQEMNLLYVGITRAIDELVFVF